jgi:hypothetical protein
MVDTRELIFRGVNLTGFWLRRWFAETPAAEIAALYRRLAGKLADGTLAVDVERIYPLDKLKTQWRMPHAVGAGARSSFPALRAEATAARHQSLGTRTGTSSSSPIHRFDF